MDSVLERLSFELQIGGDGEEDLEDQNPHFISTISIAKIQLWKKEHFDLKVCWTDVCACEGSQKRTSWHLMQS